MLLSILLATNRTGLLACSRIAQACSWASLEIEVIVRDNSGDAQKREFLALCRRDYCNIVIAEPCDMRTNFSETFRLAKGEFVFVYRRRRFLLRSRHRVVAWRARSVQQGSLGRRCDRSLCCRRVARDVDRQLSERRIGRRRSSRERILELFRPKHLSLCADSAGNRRTRLRYHTCDARFVFVSRPGYVLLYLLNGKFVRLKRLLYLYDLGVWEVGNTAQKRDVDFYTGAGLDPAINKLHWFLCGFEGAVLVRNSNLFPDYPLALRQVIADRWFSMMFMRFKGQPRLTFESRFTGEADELCAKLWISTGQLSFQAMLTEICSLIALFSKDNAHRYHDFWSAMLNKQKPIPCLAGVAAQNVQSESA